MHFLVVFIDVNLASKQALIAELSTNCPIQSNETTSIERQCNSKQQSSLDTELLVSHHMILANTKTEVEKKKICKNNTEM